MCALCFVRLDWYCQSEKLFSGSLLICQNPKLVARLEKIQAQVDAKEYDRMVKNVDVSVSGTTS